MTAPVALVTGGARRLGAAIARALAGRGCAVAVHCNRSVEEASALVAELGPLARVFCGDLAEPAAPGRLIAEVRDAMGSLAVLVNSASSFQRTPLASVTPEQWDDVLAVNLRAPFFLALEASRIMDTGGCIVNFSDHLAVEYTHGYVAHGVAKAGVATMTRMLAAQLAPRVRVNAVVPGVVLPPDHTTPAALEALAGEAALRRNGAPRDVVRAVEYLIDAEFVTGEILTVDGGRTLMR